MLVDELFSVAELAGRRKSTPHRVAMGQRLRALRLALGYETQGEFGVLAGLPPGDEQKTISAYERGVTRIPEDFFLFLATLSTGTADFIINGDPMNLSGRLRDALQKQAGAAGLFIREKTTGTAKWLDGDEDRLPFGTASTGKDADQNPGRSLSEGKPRRTQNTKNRR